MREGIRIPWQKLMEHRRHSGSQYVICTKRTDTAKLQVLFEQKKTFKNARPWLSWMWIEQHSKLFLRLWNFKRKKLRKAVYLFSRTIIAETSCSTATRRELICPTAPEPRAKCQDISALLMLIRVCQVGILIVESWLRLSCINWNMDQNRCLRDNLENLDLGCRCFYPLFFSTKSL